MRSIIVGCGDGQDEIVSGLHLGWPGCEVASAPAGGIFRSVGVSGLSVVVVQAGESRRQEWLPLIRMVRAFAGAIFVVSSRDSDADLIEALDAGADDFFSSPLNPATFVARVRAAIRRIGDPSTAVEPLGFGDISIDTGRHEVACCDRTQDFTATEFKILQALVEGRDLVTRKDDLCSALWGRHGKSEDDALRKHILMIRQKLNDTSCAVCVDTVAGVGYRLSQTSQR